ncbi:ArsI/CadI family heavy metal resistance metalloenzyme [Ferviditalea candida]|uniref:ArsI/CadI family heavy metal resistance metalloenzyme n=1 Tax=Ferviditalea candida TaxID=3108399 RepID=A0ABU5ZLY2_9BACL|nr:ArsI/CadI family heavy metal resistance metalloenzyme [Paenibacillaceae bacterium T2]
MPVANRSAYEIDEQEFIFGVEPVKVKTDYAKFLLDNPEVNFTLNLKNEVKGNQVGHFGFQVSSMEELTEQRNRILQEELPIRDELDTDCCYANQDKFWITDPDGNEWEFFYTKKDIEQHGMNHLACCTTTTMSSACC